MALFYVSPSYQNIAVRLSPAEHQYRLTKLNTVAFLQWVRLVLIDQLPIDLRTIGAALIFERIVAIAQVDERGVQT